MRADVISRRVFDVQIYLPIAAMPVGIFTLLGASAAVGFVSGLFGVGGGFLLTPLLIFMGLPPAVAVATASSQIAAASLTGSLAYWRRRAIDFKLALVLAIGGVIGALLGVIFFNAMKRLGHLETVIVFSYIVLLGAIGGFMLIESLRAIVFPRLEPKLPNETRSIDLPFKTRFAHSDREISLVPLACLAVFVGFVGAFLGVGGGFVLVPALIYFFRVPTSVVVGTALVQQLVTMVAATLLHATTNHSVDLVLALILIVGGVVGAKLGARAHVSIRPDYFRLLLGLLVFGVAVGFAAEILIAPEDPFTVSRTDVLR